jgi:ribose 5-phosphate isomerase A
MEYAMELAKKAAGLAAAEWIHDGMLLGLGTGTTVYYFIEKLGERCKEGLKIQAVASSKESEQLAAKKNIPIIDINQITSLDLTVDGADKIDDQKRMIKGGGGALVRERIIASMSKEMVVIVDETKLAEFLGKCKLPVEILPFAYPATIKHISCLGYTGKLRKNKNGALFVTDNGNYIFDIILNDVLHYPELEHEKLIHLPGVIDTGLFFHLADRVIIGHRNGKISLRD